MKLKKITLYAAAVGTIFFSCSEDRLIELPVDQFPLETAISSESDMRLVLNGVYDQFSTSAGFGTDIIAFGDLISDNVFITAQQVDVAYATTGSLNWSPDISDFGMLDELYDGIAQSNIVINNSTLPETETVKNYKGEALIARGLAYYYAVSFYSSTPSSGLNQDFGVPLNLGDYDPTLELPRATVSQVYDQIISDLTSGISFMTNEQPLNKGYLSPTAARLMLSRVYLTRGQAGDYQKAIQYADQVINSAGTNSFDFVTKSNYVNYFSGADSGVSENQPETIWEINMNATPGENTGVNNSLAAFFANNGSKRRFLFTKDFYDSYVATDIRKSLYTLSTIAEDNPRGYFTRKYIRLMSGEQPGPWTQNTKVLRMSEAKLNKIEALFKVGDATNALILLNEFAVERGNTPYSEATLSNILIERRKEFAAEGQRFFDLKRNNLGFNKTSNCYSIICDVPANYKLFVIPMPLREMTINSNMTQYPDWQ